MVRTFARSSEIVWRASRFPRFVVFVEPGPEDGAEPEKGSIFESPRVETKSLASVTAVLEDLIKDCLAGAASRL